jgi:RNA polymerase sigma-70 factor (ECF subfamily)
MQGESFSDGRKSAANKGPEGPEDADLVAAVTRGDKAALASLYDRHGGLLLGLGMRILSDRTLAEDVLHDVFLEAWHHAADFDPARGTVRAWLVTRMRSRALDRRASVVRQRRLAEEMKQQAGDHVGSAGPGAGGDTARVRLQIAGLAPELSEVIELAYFEGLSSSEIALRLGIPIGTVKSRTARALTSLREGLGAVAGEEGE